MLLHMLIVRRRLASTGKTCSAEVGVHMKIHHNNNTSKKQTTTVADLVAN
jgi:hypothetical protein